MLRKSLAVVVLSVFMAGQFGCYNTYNVTLDELGNAQEGGSLNAVKVKTGEKDEETGEDVEIVVTENSRIGVTEKDGTYHQISPFNFTITPGQLVAPDEDLLLPTSGIETGNVKVISGTKTTLLIIAGVAAVLGAGLTIALTAEERTDFGQ